MLINYSDHINKLNDFRKGKVREALKLGHKIDEAMRLLVKYKYKIIDLENQLIDSTNIDRHTERVRYNRVPKHNRVYLNK